MWRWFRNKAGAHPLAQPGGEIADEAEAGTFQLPPTRVEALYAPEMFGESPNVRVSIK